MKKVGIVVDKDREQELTEILSEAGFETEAHNYTKSTTGLLVYVEESEVMDVQKILQDFKDKKTNGH